MLKRFEDIFISEMLDVIACKGLLSRMTRVSELPFSPIVRKTDLQADTACPASGVVVVVQGGAGNPGPAAEPGHPHRNRYGVRNNKGRSRGEKNLEYRGRQVMKT